MIQKLEKEKEIERILLFENIILQLDEQEEVEGLEMHLNTLQTTQFLLTKGSTKELCEYKGGSVIPILVTQAMEKRTSLRIRIYCKRRDKQRPEGGKTLPCCGGHF